MSYILRGLDKNSYDFSRIVDTRVTKTKENSLRNGLSPFYFDDEHNAWRFNHPDFKNISGGFESEKQVRFAVAILTCNPNLDNNQSYQKIYNLSKLMVAMSEVEL